MTFRLDPVRRTAFDARLARFGGVKLTRAGGVTYLESDHRFADATQQLALAGVRASSCTGAAQPETDLRLAIAFDLGPLDDAFGAIDVLEVRPIPLGHASAALMHRPVPWVTAPRTARDACRRLLRDEDVVLGWRRLVWCSLASLKGARKRVRLRPVVFDRAAVERNPLRWTYASAGAIERWAFT